MDRNKRDNRAVQGVTPEAERWTETVIGAVAVGVAVVAVGKVVSSVYSWIFD